MEIDTLMDLRSLQYFVAVVKAGSFSKAAEELHISQPTLSKAIGQLEDELGVSLLERGRRGVSVRLTPAGELTYSHAQAMLDRRRQLLSELAAMRELRMGELSLGLAPLGGAEIFAPMLAKFKRTYPGIAVNMVQSGSQRLEQHILDGSLEMATMLLPLGSEFDWFPLRDDGMAVLLSANNDMAGRPHLFLRELADFPMVMFDNTFVISRMLRDAFREEHVPLNEVAHTTHLDFALALVAAEAGGLILPLGIAHQVAKETMAVVPLKHSHLRWKLVLAWRHGVPLSAAAQAWLHIVKTMEN
ncbi:MAG TPA: LysR substrate-binding domain-containing protein [Noviherbaspirillum sp.]|nr:LysR substrate-binding domain-containing protein [Noviherbaspirillum sp.]